MSLAQSLLPKNADFGRFIGKEGFIFFNETLLGYHIDMYLSDVGYSEFVQRLCYFYESHGPPPSGDVRDSTSAPPQPSRWSAKWTHFLSLFCLLLPWRPLGQYGASSRLMAVFSGFHESPGPPSSGDARGIAPSHRHGCRNDQQRRYMCSLSPPLLFKSKCS